MKLDTRGVALISGLISVALTIVVWILLTPFLNAVILLILPSVGTMTAFFIKITSFFVMLILILTGFNVVANGTLFGGG